MDIKGNWKVHLATLHAWLVEFWFPENFLHFLHLIQYWSKKFWNLLKKLDSEICYLGGRVGQSNSRRIWILKNEFLIYCWVSLYFISYLEICLVMYGCRMRTLRIFWTFVREAARRVFFFWNCFYQIYSIPAVVIDQCTCVSVCFDLIKFITVYISMILFIQPYIFRWY